MVESGGGGSEHSPLPRSRGQRCGKRFSGLLDCVPVAQDLAHLPLEGMAAIPLVADCSAKRVTLTIAPRQDPRRVRVVIPGGSADQLGRGLQPLRRLGIGTDDAVVIVVVPCRP